MYHITYRCHIYSIELNKDNLWSYSKCHTKFIDKVSTDTYIEILPHVCTSWQLITQWLLGPRFAGALIWSICPSVFPSKIACLYVCSIPSLPLAQSDSYLTHRVPLGSRCAMALNHVFRSNVKVIAELYKIPLLQSGSYFIHIVSMVKGCTVALNEVCRTGVKVISENANILFFQILIYTFHLALFGLNFK